MSRIFLGFFFLLLMAACKLNNKENIFDKIDQHSYAIPSEAKVTHLDLALELDFDSKTIKGTAVYDLMLNKNASKVIFDTRDLNIESVSIQIDQNW